MIIGILTYILIGIGFGFYYELYVRKVVRHDNTGSPFWYVIFWPLFLLGVLVGWIETRFM